MPVYDKRNALHIGTPQRDGDPEITPAMTEAVAARIEETGGPPEARQNWSYLVLVEAQRRLVKNSERDAAKLFRRVCYNALISNIDDSPRATTRSSRRRRAGSFCPPMISHHPCP